MGVYVSGSLGGLGFEGKACVGWQHAASESQYLLRQPKGMGNRILEHENKHVPEGSETNRRGIASVLPREFSTMLLSESKAIDVPVGRDVSSSSRSAVLRNVLTSAESSREKGQLPCSLKSRNSSGRDSSRTRSDCSSARHASRSNTEVS